MKKASIALVMGLFMVLTACSSAEIENHTESFTGSYMASSTENLPMEGAWSPIQGDQDSEIGQDALKAFEKATKDLEGKDGKWSLATWAQNGYSYAIGVQDDPMAEEELLHLIEKTS